MSVATPSPTVRKVAGMSPISGNVPLPVFYASAKGANGNGTTDATTAINNTIAAASAAGGGIVEIGQGTYLISASLLLASNVIVRGQGIGATIIKLANGTAATSDLYAHVFYGYNVTHAAVKSLSINGNQANQAVYNSNPYVNYSDNCSCGVLFEGGSDNLVEDVAANFCQSWGVDFRGCPRGIANRLTTSFNGNGGIGFHWLVSVNIVATGGTFTLSVTTQAQNAAAVTNTTSALAYNITSGSLATAMQGLANYGSATGGPYYAHISQPSTGVYKITIDTGPNVTGVSVNGASLTGTSPSATAVFAGNDGSEVSNSTCTSDNSDAIRVECNRVTVRHNSVSIAGGASPSVGFAGVYLNLNASNVIIDSNRVFSNSGHGIDLNAAPSLTSTGNVIRGNVCYLNNSCGISCGMSNTTLTDNINYNNGLNIVGSTTQLHGIMIQPGTYNCKIKGNNCFDLRPSGSQTQVYGYYTLGSGGGHTLSDNCAFMNKTGAYDGASNDTQAGNDFGANTLNSLQINAATAGISSNSAYTTWQVTNNSKSLNVIVTNSGVGEIQDPLGTMAIQFPGSGKVTLPNIPTSSSGLTAGMVWRNGTTLEIV